MIKLILFDIGNVLVKVNQEKMYSAVAKYSKMDRNAAMKIMRKSKTTLAFEKGLIDSKQFFNQIKKEAQLEKLKYSNFKFQWNKCIGDSDPAIEDLIYQLSNDYKLAIASDTNEFHAEFLHSKLSVLKKFDNDFSSYKVGKIKKDKQYWLELVEKIDCDPDECLFIDDKEKNVEMAEDVGIHGITYTTYDELFDELEDYHL